MHAIDFIINTCLNTSEKIYLCPTGPLTNIASALIKEPSIKNKIEDTHELKKYNWQKKHLSNQTGTNKAYNPKKNKNAIKKKYKAWNN